LIGHYVNYRKQISPSMKNLLPESDFRVFAVSVRSTETLASGTQVTGAGFKELAQLKKLNILHMVGTNLTDDGIKELAQLKNLKEVFLSETRVTDVGLKELTQLKNLNYLNLRSTEVTNAGM
jgi:internalin A